MRSRLLSVGVILASLVAVVSKLYAASIDQRIEQYLMEHPEVVVKALELGSQRMLNARLQDIISYSDSDIVMVNPKGSSRLVAYIDYRCDACKRSFQYIERFANAHPDVALILRPLPILGGESTLASLMAYDAGKLQHAKVLTDELLQLDKPLDSEALSQVASHHQLKVTDNPREHWAFKHLAENYRQSSMLNNQSVPLYILSVKGQSQMFSGLSSQQILEEAYQRLA